MNNNTKTINKIKIKRYIFLIALVIIAAIAYAAITRFTISINSLQASQLAIDHVGGGQVASPDLDWAFWRWLWYIEVLHEGIVHEIYLNPHSGDIVRHETYIWN